MTIPDIALLTADDERDLATAVEAGVLAEGALAGLVERPVTATTEELAALVRSGRIAERTFWMANLRLIKLVSARASAISGVPEEDLFQNGWIGLADAVRRFDHRRGVRFATYALPWIRARVREAVQRHHVVRVPGRRSGTPPPRMVPLEEVHHGRAAAGSDHTDDFERVELAAVDWGGLGAGLSEREWQVVRLRFGFDEEGPCTHEEVARRIGCSHATARRVEIRALSRLRRMLTRHGIESVQATRSAA